MGPIFLPLEVQGHRRGIAVPAIADFLASAPFPNLVGFAQNLTDLYIRHAQTHVVRVQKGLEGPQYPCWIIGLARDLEYR